MSTYEQIYSAGDGIAATSRRHDRHGTAAKSGADLNGFSFADWLGAVSRAIGRWRRRRVAVGELRRMDSRLLQDIGIEPAQIERVAHDISLRRGGNWLRI